MFTIRKRLLVLSLSGVLPILGVGGAAYQAILTHQRDIQAMLTSGAALRNHGQAGMLHDALRADIFEALAVTAPAERTRLRAGMATHARELRETVARNRAVSLAPEIAARLSRLGLAFESYIGESEAIMALLERDRDAAVARLPRFQQAYESLKREQEEVYALILMRNEAIEAHAARAAANSQLLIGGLSLLAAAGLGLAAWLLGRAIATPLTGGLESISTGSRQVAATAAQISDSAQKLAQVAGRQASALDETSASAEEVRALAEKSAGISATAASRTRETVDGMRHVNGALRETVLSMDEIVDSSSKISKIIKVIEEIAFQTNILALNAAVEAARAGEAGLGFAVVAEEVRNLARRSAEAARNTTAMIEEAIVRSQSGKKKLDDVSSLIAAVTANVENIQSLSEEVNASSGNQARAIREIASSVAELQAVTQQIAANVEENAAASEELTAQAAKVDAAIADVSHMLGGGGATTRIAGRAPVERGIGMFAWSSRFEIGIEAVDAQHQRLFGLARQLYNAMNAGLGREVLARLLQELLQYTETHFAFEERLMRDSGYPDYAQHKARHDALTEKVRRFAAEFQAGHASVSIELMSFLRDWLSDHILKSDLAYQPHLQKSGVVANSRS